MTLAIGARNFAAMSALQVKQLPHVVTKCLLVHQRAFCRIKCSPHDQCKAPLRSCPLSMLSGAFCCRPAPSAFDEVVPH